MDPLRQGPQTPGSICTKRTYALAVAASMLAWLPAQQPAPPAKPSPRTPREAMVAALAWLVAHQDEDGHWSASQFVRHDPKGDLCTGTGKPDQDFHVTAWATMALLGGGHTAQRGEHRNHVVQTLEWIQGRIGKDGFLGEPTAANAIAAHAIATFALCEGSALSNDKPPSAPLLRLAALRRADGTWPARPGDGVGDANATWWACWALLSGREFGVVPFDLAPTVAFADGHHDFLPPATDAVLRIFAGRDRKADRRLDALGQQLVASPPRWPAAPRAQDTDFLSWQVGTCVMFQLGGDEWQRWEEALERELLPHQRTDGAHDGSWDPVDVRGTECGRVYATAVNALALTFGLRRARLQAPPARGGPPPGGKQPEAKPPGGKSPGGDGK